MTGTQGSHRPSRSGSGAAASPFDWTDPTFAALLVRPGEQLVDLSLDVWGDDAGEHLCLPSSIACHMWEDCSTSTPDGHHARFACPLSGPTFPVNVPSRGPAWIRTLSRWVLEDSTNYPYLVGSARIRNPRNQLVVALEAIHIAHRAPTHS